MVIGRHSRGRARPRRPERPPPAARMGFTLVELLVVIGIIAVLAAIVFPVLAKAREKGRQTTCRSNLKQIAAAALMYAGDYDDVWVPMSIQTAEYGVIHAATLLLPYTGTYKVSRCPSWTREPERECTDPVKCGQWQVVRRMSYGYNCGSGASGRAPWWWGCMGRPDSAIESPAETLFAGDSWCINIGPGDGRYPSVSGVCADWNTPHQDMGNFAFCDGHVKALKKIPWGYWTIWGAD